MDVRLPPSYPCQQTNQVGAGKPERGTAANRNPSKKHKKKHGLDPIQRNPKRSEDHSPAHKCPTISAQWMK